jgi:CelD/BcsL family acetyltransferase involved in cellulose biosynthesis
MHTPLASALRIEWRPLSFLHTVADEWRSLGARALEPNVFYEPAFAFAAEPVFGADVHAALVWLGPKLVGFFPGKIERHRYGVNLPVLVGWTHPYAPLGTPLIAGEFAQEVLIAWLEHLAGRSDLPAQVLLPLVPEKGLFATALNAVMAGRRHAAFAAHQRALLAPIEARTDYLQRTVNGRTRKEWRRQRRRLEEKGTVTFASAAGAVALDEFLNLEASGWKGRAGTAAQTHDGIRKFMRQAVADLGGDAAVHRLLLNGKAVAAAITLRSRDRGWFWKIAYDESFAHFSPGVLLALELTETLLGDDGLVRVDSCAIANHPMIDRLWGERLALVDRLILARPSKTFGIVCRLEALRRAGIATAKRLLSR